MSPVADRPGQRRMTGVATIPNSALKCAFERKLTMKNGGTLLMASCVAALLCMSSAASAQTPAAPVKGTAAMNSVTVTATVTAIDLGTRAVSIKTTDGKEYSFIAGDAV